KLTLVIEHQLGSGAAGTVYKGLWGSRVVAFKKFNLTEGESRQKVIQCEIRLMKTLLDRHIIQFYGEDYYENQLVIIMEYAEGGSLKEVIDKGGKLSWLDKSRIADEIARGLEYMHGQQVLHRDLKSANVLLTRHLKVKLCDFGLSEVRALSITRSTETLQGTLRWMAPEVLCTTVPKYSTKSDVYALGMVMWEMAADCTKPFRYQSNEQVVGLLVTRGQREGVPDGTPPEYRRWLKQCWDQEPSRRPEATEVIMMSTRDAQLEISGTLDDSNIISFGSSFGQSSLVLVSLEDASEERKTSATSPLPLVTINISHMSGTPNNDISHDGTPPSRSDVGHRADDKELWTAAGMMSLKAIRAADGRKMAQLPAVKKPGRPRMAARDDGEREELVAKKVLMMKYGSGHDTSKAFERFKDYLREAEVGRTWAQIVTGCNYYDGQGTPQDYIKAATWFQRAAEGGIIQAQYNLGWMFYNAKGVRHDYSEAAFWYQKAAMQGLADAQNNLGCLYQSGYGVAQDNAKALYWFLEAAMKGLADAQYNVGVMFENGLGIDQSYYEAARWYYAASKQGHADAQNNLGWLFETGLAGEQNYHGATSLYRLAASQGHADAQFSLGLMYCGGLGLPKNWTEAMWWFRKAADQGHAEALYSIGWMFENGSGVEQNYAEAMRWFRKAANQDHADALYSIGWIFESGSGVEKNDDEAEICYLRAAELGSIIARRGLARLHENRRDDHNGLRRVRHWYSRESGERYGEAQLH
ncbi:hypothetical protein DFQ27_009974, partial [Actinomortierella ambigua]